MLSLESAGTKLSRWTIVPFTLIYCAYFLGVCYYALRFPGWEGFQAYIPSWFHPPASSSNEPSYSLWLSPSSSHPAHPILAQLIGSLPGPAFPPHATLLGEAPKGTTLPEVLEAIEKALDEGTFHGRKEEGRGKGMIVEFEDVRTGEEYFRCVLVKLKETLSSFSSTSTPSPIVSLHRHLLHTLPSKTERKPFYPHISLLYSHIPISPDREEIVRQLYDDGTARAISDEEGGGVELFAPGTEKGEGKGVREMICDRVSVVQTKGLEVKDWVVVGEVMI